MKKYKILKVRTKNNSLRKIRISGNDSFVLEDIELERVIESYACQGWIVKDIIPREPGAINYVTGSEQLYDVYLEMNEMNRPIVVDENGREIDF